MPYTATLEDGTEIIAVGGYEFVDHEDGTMEVIDLATGQSTILEDQPTTS